MARKNIGSIFDRNNRNAMNDNFRELYEDVDKYQSKITDKVYSEIVESAKLDWREPVSTYSSLPSTSTIGETRMTRNTGKVYRYDGDKWVEIQQIDAGPVNEVDSRLSSQLAQTESELNARVSQTIATAGDGTIPSELTDIRVAKDGTLFPVAGDYIRHIDRLLEVESELIQEPANPLVDFYNVGHDSGVGAGSPFRGWGMRLKPIQEVINVIRIKIKTSNVVEGSNLYVEIRDDRNGNVLAKGRGDLSATKDYAHVVLNRDVSLENGVVVVATQMINGERAVMTIVRSTKKDSNIDTTKDVGIYYSVDTEEHFSIGNNSHNGFLYQMFYANKNELKRVITNIPSVSAPSDPTVISKTHIVAKSGGQYTNIQSAVDNAVSGDTVLIYPGIYHEYVDAKNKELNLIGISKDNTVLYNNTSMYDTPPLEMAAGMVKGLTIIEDHSNPTTTDPNNNFWERAYSIHIDFPFSEGRKLIIDDCIIHNTKRPALGIGTFQDFELVIQNCDIWMGMPTREQFKTSGALYFHNRYTSANTTGQKIRVINTTVNTDGNYSLNMQNTAMDGYISELEVEFINSTFYSTVTGKENSVRGTFNNSIRLAPTSHGNNIAMLNA